MAEPEADRLYLVHCTAHPVVQLQPVTQTTRRDGTVTLLVDTPAAAEASVLRWLAMKTHMWHEATPDTPQWALYADNVLARPDLHVFVTEDTTTTLFHVIPLRHVTVFCVLQRENNTAHTRAMLYLGDRIGRHHHPAGDAESRIQSFVRNVVPTPEKVRDMLTNSLNDAYLSHDADKYALRKMLFDAVRQRDANTLTFV